MLIALFGLVFMRHVRRPVWVERRHQQLERFTDQYPDQASAPNAAAAAVI